jgi:hypothetical protein
MRLSTASPSLSSLQERITGGGQYDTKPAPQASRRATTSGIQSQHRLTVERDPMHSLVRCSTRTVAEILSHFESINESKWVYVELLQAESPACSGTRRTSSRVLYVQYGAELVSYGTYLYGSNTSQRRPRERHRVERVAPCRSLPSDDPLRQPSDPTKPRPSLQRCNLCHSLTCFALVSPFAFVCGLVQHERLQYGVDHPTPATPRVLFASPVSRIL